MHHYYHLWTQILREPNEEETISAKNSISVSQRTACNLSRFHSFYEVYLQPKAVGRRWDVSFHGSRGEFTCTASDLEEKSLITGEMSAWGEKNLELLQNLRNKRFPQLQRVDKQACRTTTITRSHLLRFNDGRYNSAEMMDC